MQKKLEYFIKILIGVSFFIPLIVLPETYIFPFIVPKIIWFRSVVLLMLGAYLLLLSLNWSRYKIKLNPLNIVVSLFFISFAISTFVGVDWYRSLWDNHERMLGLFTVFHYVIYYFIITSVVREWKDWKWLFRTFLFAGGIVMFIGLLQTYVNHDLFLNRGATSRVSSTLGNSIYFSGYGLFLMFVGYLLAIKENIKKSNPWFWYAVVGGLLGFWGVFGGGTRGALLGLIAGLGVLVISYILSLKDHKKIRQGLSGLIVLGVIIMGLLFSFRQTDFVKNIPAVGRLVNTEISSTNTRVMAWGVAIGAWQEKPVFGWGPNNYYYAFNKHYRAEFLERGWGETWFDNAHSVVMNTLAVQGAFGIVTYLGIFVVAITMLWRKYKKGEVDAHIVCVGSAFLVAHLVSLVTVFDNPTSYLYFFFFLAFVASLVSKKEDVEKKKGETKDISVGLIVVVGLVVLLMIYSTNINPARVNKKTLQSIRQLSSDQVEQVINTYKDIENIPSPHIDDVRNDFGRLATQSIVRLNNKNQKEQAIKLFNFSYKELQKNTILHPLDIRVKIQLSQLAVIGFEIKQDPSFLLASEKYLEESLKASPRRQQLAYTLSPIKHQLGKVDEAIKLLQDSISNDPNIGDGWWRLVMLYQQIGEIDKAKETAQEAVSKSVNFDSQGANVINSILESN